MEQDRDERIRQRAHEIWEREGRQDGSQDENWQRAERELSQQEGSQGEDSSNSENAPQRMSAEGTAGGASRRKR